MVLGLYSFFSLAPQLPQNLFFLSPIASPQFGQETTRVEPHSGQLFWSIFSVVYGQLPDEQIANDIYIPPFAKNIYLFNANKGKSCKTTKTINAL
jgi:hypothetical protein